ncbi:MAG TPA: NADH-quinone oxidoreductase subunit H, partial [Leucothrix sp.]|nr:NADH-quinone oxidoreductase subunit H [Leucothrix sp.]
MKFEWMQIPWSLLTLFIVITYGLLMTALIQKIGARV